MLCDKNSRAAAAAVVDLFLIEYYITCSGGKLFFCFEGRYKVGWLYSPRNIVKINGLFFLFLNST